MPMTGLNLNFKFSKLKNMKRLPIFLFVFVVLLFLPVTFLSAQDFNFNRAYDDYLHAFNLYRGAHLEYVSAKSEYLTYKTLESQTKALGKTRNMLSTRNMVLTTYLTALRMKLAQMTKIVNYEQNMKYILLDNQVSFLKTNEQKLPSPATLEDLLKVSSEVEEKYPEIEVLAYQTLGTIASDQEEGLRSRLVEEVKKVEEKINEARNQGEDTATVERWLIEVKEKISLSEQKQSQARNILSGLRAEERDKRSVWLSAQRKFEEGNQYLKEAVSYLKEIIKRIKYD